MARPDEKHPSPAEPQAALDAVACPSPSTCVAVGGVGGVDVSRTAGRIWSTIKVPTDHYLYGVACPTPTRCVAVGDAGTVLLTRDGGEVWRREKSGVTRPLSAVACPSRQRCDAVGDRNTIITSTDGGASWRRTHSGTGVLDGVGCSTVDVCAAVTSISARDLTTANGWTWASVSVPFNFLAALAPMNGIGCHAERCVAVGGRGLVALSTDGGAAWSVGTSHSRVDLWAVTCPSANQCLAVGAGGAVLLTEDGGATWRTAVTRTEETLLGVACATTSFCAAVGSGGTVITTSDGGTVWSVRTGQSAPAPALRVLVVGDSFAHTLAAGITRNATAYGVSVFDGSLDGCALASGGPVLMGVTPRTATGPCAATGSGWLALYQSDVTSVQPALSVLALGPWDLTTRFIDGAWLTPGQPGFDAYYAQQIITAVRILSAEGGHVVITTMPEVRPKGPELCAPPPASVPDCPTETERVAALNNTAKTVASELKGQVILIDLNRRLAPKGTFVSTVDGTVVRADGVHLSEPGGEWLTPWLVPQLLADAR
jgi:photosystem II stability/assembly factor-like uncharacterized protein